MVGWNWDSGKGVGLILVRGNQAAGEYALQGELRSAP